MFDFLINKKKTEKEKLNCLGIFDCKPFDFFESGMVYAKDVLIEEKKEYKIYARMHKKTVLIFALILDETNFNLDYFNIKNLEPLLNAHLNESYQQSVLLIVFQNSNETTIGFAKNVLTNTKKELNQILIFNAAKVRLEYYRPIPTFYNKIYQSYLEAIYFDLACIDKN